jgi:hypothetical protein
MTTQLILIDESTPVWRLDDHTKELGRQGVATAREILRRARNEAASANQDTTHEHAHAA